MLKLTLLVTAVLSFINFWFPAVFEPVKKTGEKVLGIRQINQTLNIETVRLATLSYCLSNNKLPEKLNDLFQAELAKEKFLDLDEHFFLLKSGSDCEFEIRVRK